jgi:diguanylate cyclase (GGDEF)-like protein
LGVTAGEEFLLIIPGCNLATTVRRANQIREIISNTPISVAQGDVTVSVSMGVSVAESSTNSELLLHDADTALYRAKRNGRNRVEQAAASAAAAAV